MNKIFYVTIFIFILCSSVYAKIDESYIVNKEYDKFTKLWESDNKIAIINFKDRLKNGTKYEKEAVLEIFQKEYIIELVPSVIEAMLDDTISPAHGDTGWGRIYHQAATAMSEFAYRIDKIIQKERGYTKFSFYDDVGTATEERRKEVYNNWLQWWKNYKETKK